ncbi:hypothetical protein CPB84DRAFT_1859363 [Gymnopilus junonius]|uniref:Uncharacterized protein n=1 Tax=Gymnopilus junonius TaxID=109634 RepID=A0A9P5N8F7_GYMJU|nr:hypothetical protein CPB84DRAFT_1859363 [Gymnopilus junonius]
MHPTPIPSPPKIQSMTFPQQPLLSIPATPGPTQEPVLQKTPPRTPDDYTASSDSLDFFPIIITTPVAGMETMDALVDGMNGRDGLLSRTSSTCSRFAIPGHHPLYQPPLPTPPPGVILGGVMNRTHTGLYRLLELVEDGCTLPPPEPPLPLLSHHPQLLCFPVMIQYLILALSIRKFTHGRTPPPALKTTKVLCPQYLKSSTTMLLLRLDTQGHATVREEAESEPDPLACEEDDAEFLSRSSMDSVADEVQCTIRNQNMHKAHRPTPPPPSSSAHPFLKQQSMISDNNSIYSPHSDPGAASIYSVSAPSSYVPPSPFEAANFLSMVKNSPSQAVAQYLHSAQLTTLLKLTWSPHASQDNPLTVSLLDLGNLTGFPIIMFLGLGCVHHIVGLYNEMASCMGLRLITIDRRNSLCHLLPLPAARIAGAALTRLLLRPPTTLQPTLHAAVSDLHFTYFYFACLHFTYLHFTYLEINALVILDSANGGEPQWATARDLSAYEMNDAKAGLLPQKLARSLLIMVLPWSDLLLTKSLLLTNSSPPNRSSYLGHCCPWLPEVLLIISSGIAKFTNVAAACPDTHVIEIVPLALAVDISKSKTNSSLHVL